MSTFHGRQQRGTSVFRFASTLLSMVINGNKSDFVASSKRSTNHRESEQQTTTMPSSNSPTTTTIVPDAVATIRHDYYTGEFWIHGGSASSNFEDAYQKISDAGFVRMPRKEEGAWKSTIPSSLNSRVVMVFHRSCCQEEDEQQPKRAPYQPSHAWSTLVSGSQ